MTNFDYSWQALLAPREKAELFEFHADSFSPTADRFTLTNAWWMAQLCQIAYFPSAAEFTQSKLSIPRSEILGQHNLKELHSIDVPGAQGYVTTMGNLNVLALRGTDDINDWAFNVKIHAVPWAGGGQVHQGFLEAFDNIATILNKIRNEHPEKRWIIAGHSLGAAIGVLASTILQPVQSYLFGCPRIGDARFCENFDNKYLFDIRNEGDLVSTIPDAFGAVHFLRPGMGIWLHNGDWEESKGPATASPFPDISWSFKRLTTPADWHKPIKELSDHSIINYIAQIESLLRSSPFF